MTLGDGIFWSTVLVLFAVTIRQITRTQKWKLVGKILAAGVLFCAVTGFAFYLWTYFSNLPPALSVVTKLSGAELGMSSSDIKLALGSPDKISESTVLPNVVQIDYHYDGPSLDVDFYGGDKYTATVQSVCTSDPYTRLMGFKVDDSKDLLLARLGKPSATSIDSSSLYEIFSYAKWKASFFLSQGKIYRLCIHAFPTMAFTKELLSPEQQRALDESAARLKAESEAKAVAEAKQKEHSAGTSTASRASNSARSIGDPCAPEISKKERLRRLSQYGAVRQNSSTSYYVGNHQVSFDVLGNLVYCQ